MQTNPRAVIFDMDDTLAESFESPKPEMIARLEKVLSTMPIAVMTGRNYLQIEPHFLPELASCPNVDRFFLLPESSAQCLQWDGHAWVERYSHSISDETRARIHQAIEEALAETAVLQGLPHFGEQFIDKRAQVSFACLGVNVQNDLKHSWDPGNAKRKILQLAVAKRLPEYDVFMGGASTIDVTERGMNKTFGVRWLSEHLHIPPQEMLYVGDSLYEGGNDFVVISTGIQTRSTSGPEETLQIIDEILAVCQRS